VKKQLSILGGPAASAQINGLTVPVFEVADQFYLKSSDLGKVLGYTRAPQAIYSLRSHYKTELAQHVVRVWLRHKGKQRIAASLISLAGCEILAGISLQKNARKVQSQLRVLRLQTQTKEENIVGVKFEGKDFQSLHGDGFEDTGETEHREAVVEEQIAPAEVLPPVAEVLPVQADPETDTLPVVGDPVKVVEFHGQEVPVYEVNGDLYLTGEDLGKILGLADPRRGVWNIFERHREELDNYTCVIKLMKQHDQKRATRLYSQDGCYLISMFARTDTAKDVRQWLAALPRQVRQALEATPEMLAQMREATIEDLAYRLLTLLSTPAGGKLGIDGMRRLTRLRAAGSMTQKEAGRMFEIPVDAVRLIEKEMAPIMGLEIKPFNRYEENRRVNRDLAKMMAKKIAMDLEATVATPASPRDRKKMH